MDADWDRIIDVVAGTGEANSPAVMASLDRVRTETARLRATLALLMPLCPCPTAAEDERSQEPGPRQECPIHGDGVTFVEYVGALENAARTAFGPNALDIVREVVAE
jgi:hypothetical protein